MGNGYEPIENASIDELRALQLERMITSVANAYQNVDHYRTAFDAAGVSPADLKSLDDLAKFPFLTKADLRGQLSVWHVRRAPGSGVPDSRLVRYHRKTDRCRLHRGRHQDLGNGHGPIDLCRRRAGRGCGPRGIRLWPVHRRPRRPLRSRGHGLHRRPGVGRADRETGDADRGLQTADHPGHPVVLPQPHR